MASQLLGLVLRSVFALRLGLVLLLSPWLLLFANACDSAPETLEPAPLAPDTVQPKPVHHLNQLQYANTVAALFAVTVAPEKLPRDDRVGAFRFGLTMGRTQAEAYYHAALDVARDAIGTRATWLPCHGVDQAAVDCTRAFLPVLLRRVYRRPPSHDEMEAIRNAFDGAMAGDRNTPPIDFEHTLEALLAGLLASPQFLLLDEVGTDADGDGVVPLDGYAMAARLSYLLWNRNPDDALLDAAENGTLLDPTGLAATVEGMLADPRAEAGNLNFYLHWLGLEDFGTAEKDRTLFPNYNEALRSSIDASAQEFLRFATRGEGTLETLLTSPIAFVDQRLAALMGAEGVFGDALARVERLNPSFRRGILAHPAVIAAQSSVHESNISRAGKFLRERFLCEEIAPPPEDVLLGVTTPTSAQGVRERALLHQQDGSCAGCHERIDGLGFAFMHYAPDGSFRTHEGDAPVDASGTIVGTQDLDGDFADLAELAQKLQHSEQVRDCFVRHWVRYALGRRELPSEEPTIAKLSGAMVAASGRLESIIPSLVQSELFRFRRVAP